MQYALRDPMAHPFVPSTDANISRRSHIYNKHLSIPKAFMPTPSQHPVLLSALYSSQHQTLRYVDQQNTSCILNAPKALLLHIPRGSGVDSFAVGSSTSSRPWRTCWKLVNLADRDSVEVLLLHTCGGSDGDSFTILVWGPR